MDSYRYILGIDLGSASLGWALIQLGSNGRPVGLLSRERNNHVIPCTGVRIFEPGVDGTALDIESGKDQSKAVNRRSARLHRRQLRRRAYRQAQLFRLLQKSQLMPEAEGSGPDSQGITPSDQRNHLLMTLDKQLSTRYRTETNGDFDQLPLYFLRKEALDSKLPPFELGRIIYHLSQRRGFKSNRKEGVKSAENEKEIGQVKAGIDELQKKIKASDARTLGEYFAGLNPHEIGQNIRRRWTARKMYEQEFEAIWKNQSQYHPELLTDDLRREIEHLLFFQRPIASQSHLIGKCELEPSQRRAAWATLEAQRFRILQKVNDLKIIYPGNLIAEPLTPEQRLDVFELLDRAGDKKFTSLRKYLKLGPSEFNLENGGEARLRGNRTNVAMIEAFGERWNSIPPEIQKDIVEEWRNSESEEALYRRAVGHWQLSPEAAARWVNAKPEDGYCALSRKAIQRLMPLMLAGKSFKEAETELYGNRFSGGAALDLLPPLNVHRKLPNSNATERLLNQLRLGAIRNPAVERALTELRKVINAIVREYGKPYEIHIELARELKKPRKERQELSKKNRTRQRERDALKVRLLQECGIQNPSRLDVEKALLHEECGGICPYTGRSIRLADLFGEHPQFDVEHIIPLSRYPDDSFQNKTLCWHEENRNIKRNKTPFEAYSADAERWQAMQTRIMSWKPGNPGKLKRFQLRSEDELEEFTARQMNDTRHASVLAARLLESLYGGRDVKEATGMRRAIFASSGAVTAALRRAWQLESILRECAPSTNGHSKGKPRTDHRHHAIDALVIALTKPDVIQSMSRSASLDPSFPQDSRAFRRIPSPWPDFVGSVRPHIEQMRVSHRPEHKMSGALHDETNYGRPRQINGKTIVSIRKPVTSLSPADIESIIDPSVRHAVKEKAASLGGDLKKCESANDWPVLQSKNGKHLPIKRVRIHKSLDVTPIAAGDRQRFVALANNHHTEIFALIKNDREARWEGVPVSLYEAMDRKRRNEPVVRKSHPDGPQWKFKFSLMGGDTIELHRDCEHKDRKCTATIYRIRTIATNGQLSIVGIADARLKADIQKAKEWWSPTADALRKLECHKVVVDLLGRMRYAND